MFIITLGVTDELEGQMKEAYSKVFEGWAISTECKDYFEIYTNTYAESLSGSNREVCDDIEFPLGITGDYKEYNKRLQLWYNNQSS